MFEVRTDSICEGWVNCWHVDDKLQTFDTVAEAQAEIEEYIQDWKAAVEAGDMAEFDEDFEREQLGIFNTETGEPCDIVDGQEAE